MTPCKEKKIGNREKVSQAKINERISLRHNNTHQEL